MNDIPDFSLRVFAWFDQHGRKDLPWQQSISPYRVWVSEIMLQQTQVVTVIPYYARFMQRFPTVARLASAEIDEVLHFWSGLGYYSRAKNLHKSAQIVVGEHEGLFPSALDDLMALPGIGRSTAGAIRAIAFRRPAAILDGNVKRVLARVFAVEGWSGKSDVLAKLWSISEDMTPRRRIADYTQAMMDLGATVCKRSKPLCGDCPFQDVCVARKRDAIAQHPGKKPKKVLPVKQSCMVVFVWREKVFLYQRSLDGLWPGLWSFPEFEGDQQSLVSWVQEMFDFSVNQVDEFQGFRHTFSHFHLDITIKKISLSPASSMPLCKTHLWYDPLAPQEVGLAAPVSKIIRRLITDG